MAEKNIVSLHTFLKSEFVHLAGINFSDKPLASYINEYIGNEMTSAITYALIAQDGSCQVLNLITGEKLWLKIKYESSEDFESKVRKVSADCPPIPFRSYDTVWKFAEARERFYEYQERVLIEAYELEPTDYFTWWWEYAK